MYQSAKEKLNRNVRNISIAAVGMAAASPTFANVDVSGVNTAIGTAEASAHTIGTTVIGVVAGLAVVGIVIALVRKL